MMRGVRAWLVLLFLAAAGSVARGDGSQLIVETPKSRTWPASVVLSALVGTEPHGDSGSPVAFGVAGAILWKASVGGFAALLSSSGTPILPEPVNNMAPPSLADRISVPFGLAGRPLAWIGLLRDDWWGALAQGIGLEVGLSVEHLRVSDEDRTFAAFHLGGTVDVPLYGGPRAGGLALRFQWRLIAGPEQRLAEDETRTIYEPTASGQVFGGIAYYP
jgi:hypothetical protein